MAASGGDSTNASPTSLWAFDSAVSAKDSRVIESTEMAQGMALLLTSVFNPVVVDVSFDRTARTRSSPGLKAGFPLVQEGMPG